MTKTTTASMITDTAIAVDACRQLNLTGLAPALDGLCDDATRRRVSHPTFLAEALQIELDIRHERRRVRFTPFDGQGCYAAMPSPRR